MYTNIGCLNDVIALTCPNNGTINVSKAHWGKYSLVCNDDCCPPNPAFDCTVDMEAAEPDLFEFVGEQCNGQSSCDIDFVAYAINECDVDYPCGRKVNTYLT